MKYFDLFNDCIACEPSFHSELFSIAPSVSVLSHVRYHYRCLLSAYFSSGNLEVSLCCRRSENKDHFLKTLENIALLIL